MENQKGMTAEDRKWFIDNGYIKPVKYTQKHTGSWSLCYGTQVFPEATNTSYALCVIARKGVARQVNYQFNKFTIVPFN